jgi:hypothetical protein
MHNQLIFICKDDKTDEYDILKKLLERISSLTRITRSGRSESTFGLKCETVNLCISILHLKGIKVDLKSDRLARLTAVLTELYDIIPKLEIPDGSKVVVSGHFSTPFSNVLSAYRSIKGDSTKVDYFANAMDGIGDLVLTSHSRGGEWETATDKLLKNIDVNMSPESISDSFTKFYNLKLYETRIIPIKKDLNLLKIYLFASAVNNEQLDVIDIKACAANIVSRINTDSRLSSYDQTFEKIISSNSLNQDDYDEFERIFYNLEQQVYGL